MHVIFQAASVHYANTEYLDPSSSIRVSRKSRNSLPVIDAVLPVIKEIPQDTEVGTYDMSHKIRYIIYRV